MPKVSRAKPATNIIKAANLYLLDSDTLLSRKVSEANGFMGEIVFLAITFFLEDENIIRLLEKYKLIEIPIDRENSSTW